MNQSTFAKGFHNTNSSKNFERGFMQGNQSATNDTFTVNPNDQSMSRTGTKIGETSNTNIRS
jgi:hypothetical protein